MFTANIGTPDRIVRIIAGLALLVWFFMDQSGGTLHWLKAIVGVVALATAALNFCPLYRVLGLSTK
jgi:hypothetical protein